MEAQFNFIYQKTDIVYTSVAVPVNSVISNPVGLAISQNGTIITCDTVNHTIKEIQADGTVINIPIPNNLNGPTGLAIANDGSIYVVDATNNQIQKIAPDGTATVVGPGVPFNFSYGTNEIVYTSTTVPVNKVITYPSGLGISPSGSIYVCDNVNNTIQEITRDGVVRVLPGSTGLTAPTGLAVAGDGSIYVIDSLNNQIKKIAPDGSIRVVAGDFKFTYT